MSEEATKRSGELVADEELHQRIMARPEVQARLKEVLAEMRDPLWKTRPGIATEDELVEFLHEHG